MKLHVDYETRSRADLKKWGAYRYANDPSTEIFMAGISTDEAGPFLWINPKFCVPSHGIVSHPTAEYLMGQIADPDVEDWAHNAEFERAITRYCLKEFDHPKDSQWRCTAALARKAVLPASLAAVSEVLNLGQKKFGEGYSLMRFFSIPDKKTGLFNEPKDHPEKFKKFCEYCLQDVRAEKEVFDVLRIFDLRGAHLEAFQFDARMNSRGVPVNVRALDRAQIIIDETQDLVAKEFHEITGLNPTQRDKVKALLKDLGLDLANMQAKTLDKVLEDEVPGYHADEDDDDEPEITISDEDLELLGGDVKRIVELYKMASYSAVKKVKIMRACACDDGRVRGMMMFHGASTGRWSGQKVQPHNFKKPDPKKKDTQVCYEMICKGYGRMEIEMLFGNPLEAIADCIRNFIQEPNGPMFDADYSAIEARIVCWLAGQENVLKRFREADAWTGPKHLKPDPYKDLAAIIFNVPAETITAESMERDLGKRGILGCGFQMAWKKFQATGAKYGVVISDDLAQRTVIAYRNLCDKVESLWYEVRDAATEAIVKPGTKTTARRLAFQVREVRGIPFLLMTLPSGRNLSYPWPKIEQLEGDEFGPGITFYGQLPGKKTKWGRIRTYGGKLVENATQAVAFDVMSNGACRAEEKGYEVNLLVHDQALGPVKPGQTVKEFCSALTDLPSWADGLPIVAEGKIVPYYKK